LNCKPMPIKSAIMLVVFMLIAAGADSTMAATLKDETLLTPLPKDFKVGFQTERGQMVISEFVPKDETVANWSRMITVQIFHVLKHFDPDTFASGMGKQWKAACAQGEVQKAKDGKENGYNFSLWIFTCPLNPQTQKPENMWLKTISGADSLYSVQYAYRKELNKEMIGPAVDYLRQVMACDNRRSDSPCPKGM